MSNRINVLVYPCGSENALEIHQALKDVMNIRIFGASARDDHGAYIFQRYIADAPLITDPDFPVRFNALLEAHGIEVVIPTHDDVSLKLAELADVLRARVAVPGSRQAATCRSKRATYALFPGADFIPKTFETLPHSDDLPVFAKPDKGQGGKGAFLIRQADELAALQSLTDHLICEHLPGDELTVDCFSDRHGQLRFIGPRKRDRVFGGISVRSSIVALSDEVGHIAGRIHAELLPRGLWYFQLKQDKVGRYKLLEVSVRAASTMGLYRGLGVNLPLLTIYDLLDRDVSILVNTFQLQVDRALFNRYRSDLDFDTVYIDYDDTITNTQEGRVNPMVMLFLYSMKAKGVSLHLITKHRYDLTENMERYAIHKGLFDTIQHIRPEESKADHILKKERAIFVDNAFDERARVSREHGIPVFDVDAITTLIDWRE